MSAFYWQPVLGKVLHLPGVIILDMFCRSFFPKDLLQIRTTSAICKSLASALSYNVEEKSKESGYKYILVGNSFSWE